MGNLRPLCRWRNRREDNINMDLEEIGSEAVDLIQVAQEGDQW
jgi:hypothetical protein